MGWQCKEMVGTYLSLFGISSRLSQSQVPVAKSVWTVCVENPHTVDNTAARELGSVKNKYWNILPQHNLLSNFWMNKSSTLRRVVLLLSNISWPWHVRIFRLLWYEVTHHFRSYYVCGTIFRNKKCFCQLCLFTRLVHIWYQKSGQFFLSAPLVHTWYHRSGKSYQFLPTPKGRS